MDISELSLYIGEMAYIGRMKCQLKPLQRVFFYAWLFVIYLLWIMYLFTINNLFTYLCTHGMLYPDIVQFVLFRKYLYKCNFLTARDRFKNSFDLN